jgi:hypothetical protein
MRGKKDTQPFVPFSSSHRPVCRVATLSILQNRPSSTVYPAIYIVEFGGAIGALKAMLRCSVAQFISAVFTAYSEYVKVPAPY